MSFSGSDGDSSSADLRLLLLGNIGCGKTCSADTILNEKAPLSASASRGSVQRRGFVEGRRVTVVEAPRWYWSGGEMDESIRKETEKAMTLLAPGPHAILLLIPVFQFTEMESLVPAELERLFGEDVLNHTLILFTCGDYLIGRTLEEYLKKEPAALTQILDRCNGGCHVINNRHREDRMQVQQLLEKVDAVVQRNGIHALKTAEERELDKRIQERKRELMENYRAQREARRQSFNTEFGTNAETKSFTSRVSERGSGGRDDVEGRVEIRQVSNGLRSSQTQEQEPTARTTGLKFNSEGAVSSQTSHAASIPKITSTFYDGENGVEETSPTIPTTPPRSSFLSSSHSSSSASAFTSPSASAFSSPSASAFSSDSPRSSSQSSELRLVLVGRSRAGKSEVGNCILGLGAFRSDLVTQDCEKKRAEVCGRKVAVVDTPDWFTTEKSPDDVRAQITSCVALSSPGPHAFLLCIPVDQPANMEVQALQALASIFGTDAVQKHAIAIFTFSDRLRDSGKAKGKSIEAYISSERPDLLKVVEKCRDRFHIMERDGGAGNVAELLEMVDQTVKEAGGQCYSSPAFQEAENKVRQKQMEIAREQKGFKPEAQKQEDLRLLNSERRRNFSYMQPLEEDVVTEEMEKLRDEAEMSVSAMDIESLPPVVLSNFSPSLLQTVKDKMEAGMKTLPGLLSDGSTWVTKGAESLRKSPVWGKAGSGAQSVQKMIKDSAVWEQVAARKQQISKAVGGKIPKVVVDASASPVWGKVGSGAKSGADLLAKTSVQLGSGAKNLAQSPVWGKMGSGAKSGAKMVAESPVWGKMGSGAKAGAKMVAESPMWEKIGQTAKQVPKVVIAGAVLGLVLGVFLGGLLGGAIGAGVGSALSEVGRRKFGNKRTLENSQVGNVDRNVSSTVESVVKSGEKVFKRE
ncbi:uncharacterized protein LOC117379355 [Periophthalmus magnuspinnatus]|uniref:uncharacterized protein LOC117379355 n=1 Tax=Periophthalmus magnuspinnatus TaxID=409849 RepID=UPI00145A8338|nr:uncharacterized protein LOC117379355 [Periophthalmus magnuspinnatus]